MNENDFPVRSNRPVDRPARLRVDASGLSEATRRELGLVLFEAPDQIRTTGRESGSPGHFPAALPIRPSPWEANPAEIVARTEWVSEPDAAESGQSLTRARVLPKAETGQVRQAHGFEEGHAARPEFVHRRVISEEEHQRSHVIEPFIGAASPEPDERRVDETKSPENGLLGEGTCRSAAGDPTVLRPGRARPGEADTRPQAEPVLGRENVDKSPNQKLRPDEQWAGNPFRTAPAMATPEVRLSVTNRQEAGHWLPELQAAVSQNTKLNQHLLANLMQTLRDSVQAQRQQRVELDQLGVQLRTLLAQNASAGFNRQ